MSGTIPHIGDDEIIELADVFDGVAPPKNDHAYLRDAAYYMVGYVGLRAGGRPHGEARDIFRDTAARDDYYPIDTIQGTRLPAVGDDQIIELSERWTARYQEVGRYQQQSRRENVRDQFFYVRSYLIQRQNGLSHGSSLRAMENEIARDAGLPPETPPPPARAGHVRGNNRCFADDAGPFLALGTSLFWAAWAMIHQRDKLRRNLDAIGPYGFTSIRVLGEVGGSAWQGREVNPYAGGYDDAITGLVDLAYDEYGIRTQFAIFGGTDFSNTREKRAQLIDRFSQYVRGREHKIHFLEIGNESWHTGFPHPSGTAELRELSRRLASQTSCLVSVTSPNLNPDQYFSGQRADLERRRNEATDDSVRRALDEQLAELYRQCYKVNYEGAQADVVTVHLDRDVRKTDGHWRPVRQPWEVGGISGVPPLWSNDEPIGPGSSVASETDPMKLVIAAVVSWIAGAGQYTLHSGAGVYGGLHQPPGDLAEIDRAGEIFGGLRAAREYLPSQLPNWSKKNGHWADHPFSGSISTQFWPEQGGDGAVRDYAAVEGQRFISCPLGIRGRYDLRARQNMTFRVLHPMNGEELAQVSLDAGRIHRLEGLEAFIVVGQYR
jgi:hypothetical protein